MISIMISSNTLLSIADCFQQLQQQSDIVDCFTSILTSPAQALTYLLTCSLLSVACDAAVSVCCQLRPRQRTTLFFPQYRVHWKFSADKKIFHGIMRLLLEFKEPTSIFFFFLQFLQCRHHSVAASNVDGTWKTSTTLING